MTLKETIEFHLGIWNQHGSEEIIRRKVCFRTRLKLLVPEWTIPLKLVWAKETSMWIEKWTWPAHYAILQNLQENALKLKNNQCI